MEYYAKIVKEMNREGFRHVDITPISSRGAMKDNES
jgi:hypothetical protein